MVENNEENQPPIDDSIYDIPFSKTNLIEKLCFVVTGAGVSSRGIDCRRELSQYLGIRGDKIVSYVGLGKWFLPLDAGRTSPNRTKAYTFLLAFLDEYVRYSDLSEPRKKVFNQIKSRLVESLGDRESAQKHKAKVNHGVSVSNAGAVVIQQTETLERDYEELCASWKGTYVTFRNRLSADQSNPFSREVIRLVQTNSGLSYKHWHLKDGTALKFFQGSVLISKETLWFIGVDESTQRFRMCHLKRNETVNPDFQRYRWGLMHSDIPMGSSRDPASTKIFMRKVDVQKNIESYAEKTVSYLDGTLGGDEDAEKIIRAIDNNQSSRSEVGSFAPQPDADEVLRTCHITLEAMLKT